MIKKWEKRSFQSYRHTYTSYCVLIIPCYYFEHGNWADTEQGLKSYMLTHATGFSWKIATYYFDDELFYVCILWLPNHKITNV